MSIPPYDMILDADQVGLVFTDLQNDFLTPGGVLYRFLEESYVRNRTLDNVERLLGTSRRHDVPVFISPHYCYPADRKWQLPRGPIGHLMHELHAVRRRSSSSGDGLAGSGADWPERFKPYIEHPRTIICSPHKMYGTASNDLILQLRQHRIEQIILAGPAGNLCPESHLRDFLEHGFTVAMVSNATGGAANAEGDGHTAALVNYRAIAHALWTTDETVQRLDAAFTPPRAEFAPALRQSQVTLLS
jgi:biuret amidohydrolase